MPANNVGFQDHHRCKDGAMLESLSQSCLLLALLLPGQPYFALVNLPDSSHVCMISPNPRSAGHLCLSSHQCACLQACQLTCCLVMGAACSPRKLPSSWGSSWAWKLPPCPAKPSGTVADLGAPPCQSCLWYGKTDMRLSRLRLVLEGGRVGIWIRRLAWAWRDHFIETCMVKPRCHQWPWAQVACLEPCGRGLSKPSEMLHVRLGQEGLDRTAQRQDSHSLTPCPCSRLQRTAQPARDRLMCMLREPQDGHRGVL